MKKRVLITGSSGMLGIDLVALLQKKYDVTGTDVAGAKNPAAGCKDFIKCDISDRDAAARMVSTAKPDIVLHTAAWTDVDGCETDREKAFKINAEGTQNIALGCRESKAVIFYISSDFVFDGTKNDPYVEDDKENPLNVYGLSKFEGEDWVRKIADRYFIVRTSWLFGRHGRNFVDIILDKAERKKELKIVADQFGSPTYTRDLSEAVEHLMALSLEKSELGGVFHFCNSGSCSWYRYAEEILKIARREDAKLIPITSAELDRPAKRPSVSILDTAKYSKLCGESPRRWQSALDDYLINEQRIGRDYVPNFKK